MKQTTYDVNLLEIINQIRYLIPNVSLRVESTFLAFFLGLLFSNANSIQKIADWYNWKDQSTFNRILHNSKLTLSQLFKKYSQWLRKQIDFSTMVYLVIDDSFLKKSGDKTAGTGYGYNHSEGHVMFGQQAVLATVLNKELQLPFFSEMYDKTAKNFKSKIDLAILLLFRFSKCMNGKKFIFLFDSWYCCKKLISVLPHSIKWVSKLRRNRCIDVGEGWVSLKIFLRSVNSWRYKSISVGGDTYWVYEFEAEVKNLGKLKLIAVKKSPYARIVSAVIVSNLRDETAAVILEHYKKRWSIEVCIKNTKQILGWNNCKVRGKNAIRRHWFILHLIHSFISVMKTCLCLTQASFKQVVDLLKNKLKINGRRLAVAITSNVGVSFAKR